MTDLVEAVARAIATVINFDGEAWGLYMSRQETQDIARAVIPVVREDCAKVAESFDGCNDPVDAIAAALREGRG